MADADMDSMVLDVERRMEGAVEALQREFAGLRTGRASVGLLEPIMVEAYGTQMPMNQVGTISVPESRLLGVQVWDKKLVKPVEKAILESGLGLNPAVEGQLIRVPIPPLSEERRVELTKIAGKYAEDARVAVRNVRRSGMDDLKRAEKDSGISKDEQHAYGQDLQKLTDDYVKLIDETLAEKEQEILQV